MNIIELKSKTALNKLKRRIPYGWDLNIYRGCMHGCKYCYAMYSHDYLNNNNNFFDMVYYKSNIIELLESELSSPNWKKEVINIGGVTDSYQPLEKELGLMREVLKLMIKYKNPIIISTKSDLILRDIDLIKELSNITYVNIAFTITTMNEDIRCKLEPNSLPSIDRFKALKELKKTNAVLGVHVMPIIPYLTDTYDNLDAIYKNASVVGVNYVLPGTLYLIGKTKPYFLKFIHDEYNNIYKSMLELYKGGSAGKEYKDKLYKMIDEIKLKYNINSNYMKFQKEKLKEER